MSKRRSWTDEELRTAVIASTSIRMVIKQLRLIPAGGNYVHVSKRINDLALNTDHFRGRGWNVGWMFDPRKPVASLGEVLVKGRPIQSFQLKKRLLLEGIKQARCERCGWAEVALDGRIPVELDHINGDHDDNRLENLRILCPNCHSLQPTHRGKNKKCRLSQARVL